jgi:flagellar basal-body rod modification protein FlgD
MASVSGVLAVNDTTSTATPQGLSSIDGEGFMQILLKQLQYQDPLKPMDSEEMIAQISQIRDMELNYQLTKSLTQLTEQQRFASVAAMIGKQAQGTIEVPGFGDVPVEGTVVSIRFTESGEAFVELDNGEIFNLKDLTSVTDPEFAQDADAAQGQAEDV